MLVACTVYRVEYLYDKLEPTSVIKACQGTLRRLSALKNDFAQPRAEGCPIGLQKSARYWDFIESNVPKLGTYLEAADGTALWRIAATSLSTISMRRYSSNRSAYLYSPGNLTSTALPPFFQEKTLTEEFITSLSHGTHPP